MYRRMPPELIHELMSDVAKLPGCQMILSGVDTCFYSPETEDWFIRYLREDYHFEALPLPENMEEIDLSGIVKIAVYHDPSDTEPHPAVPLIRKMEGRLSGMVSGREWVDFMAPGVSKGRALACLQEESADRSGGDDGIWRSDERYFDAAAGRSQLCGRRRASGGKGGSCACHSAAGRGRRPSGLEETGR